MTDETRFEFHAELEAIRAEIVDIARAVIDAIPVATSILLADDTERAQDLIQWDDEIDTRTLDLEERCVHVLALQAPVAIDLRLVLATNRIIAELERSADLLVNICRAALRISGHPLDDRLRSGIEAMSDQAAVVYRSAMDAFVAKDDATAAAIDSMDSTLDELHDQFIQRIFESNKSGRIDLHVAVQLAVVARFYERIGDHAVNIAERVRFMVTGWLPEHARAPRGRDSLRPGFGTGPDATTSTEP